MESDSPPNRLDSRLVSRSRAHLGLVLAVISYWALWLAPLFVSVGLAYLFVELWDVSAVSAAKWGVWWLLAISVTMGWSLGGAVFFVMLCFRVPRIWKSGLEVASTPSGVALNEGEAPEIFAVIERIRQRTGLLRPVEVWVDASAVVRNVVYRTPDYFRDRRALVIGLPTIAVLSNADLELLVSFNLGLLNVSPLLLDRVASLQGFAQRFPPSAQAGPHYMGSRVNYFRITAQLCGRALRLAGDYAFGFASNDGGDARQATQTLLKINRGYQRFWPEHGQMMLQAGHMFPILEGFRQYWMTTFPNELIPSTPAASLFRSTAAIEARLTNTLLRSNPNVDAVSWDQAATTLLEAWKNYVKPKTSVMHGLQVKGLHDLDLIDFGRSAFHEPGRLYDPSQLRLMGGHLLAIAMAVALSRAGWDFVYSGPASPLAFRRSDKIVEPFSLLRGIVDRSIDQTAWQTICSDNEIGQLTFDED